MLTAWAHRSRLRGTCQVTCWCPCMVFTSHSEACVAFQSVFRLNLFVLSRVSVFLEVCSHSPNGPMLILVTGVYSNTLDMV